ncbi:DUF952 domain-containing protein [Actinoplanes sichuanensis]|uniref:DUF952 domain-containing protein n=1 Tax=Actinoplanes sichuanensis TaxID=512349 RepID=A0ABW4AFR6_9ACTN|nr:DUF952 domain-containing protein [Actinoplanes sichuanensis]BEL11746.1 DUF952 domain-containing protein [Actinoplanes sichuanensis]
MIFHLCPRAAWAEIEAAGFLEQTPFIHCSPADWVHVVANRIFPGRDDLVLLEIAPDGIEVVWEDGDPPEPDGRQFPHVYGRMPAGAVVAVHDYRPRPDGTFEVFIRR